LEKQQDLRMLGMVRAAMWADAAQVKEISKSLE
jgi:hypothetical protein